MSSQTAVSASAGRSCFITFEGGEGAGKTTQIRMLTERLAAAGRTDVLVTREPGGSKLGAGLRSLVLDASISTVPRAELLVMLADRAQHVDEVIRPHLNVGGIVLCDRYTDSTVAYQGWGRGLGAHRVDELNEFATGGLAPDLTILLDLDPAIGLARQSERTRLEAEEIVFHLRVREGYLAQAVMYPVRIQVVDAQHAINDVEELVWHAVSAHLAKP